MAIGTSTAGRVIALETVDPGPARDAARDILGRREFRPEQPPRPLAGAIRWLGDRLDGIVDAVGRFLGDVFGPLFRVLPGAWGTALGVAITVAAAAFMIYLLTRGRVRRHSTPTTTKSPAAPNDDPATLEAEAAEATRAGDYRRAVRLRYRAGLLRLDRAGTITLYPWSTDSALTRSVASPRFDRIADTFELVAYGGRAATRTDAETAASEWPALLDEIRGS